jgi:esterase/lipase
MLKKLDQRGWIITAGIVFAVAGFLLSLLLIADVTLESALINLIFIPAWGIAGGAVWAFLLRRGAVIRVLNGIAAGVIAGLLVHPIFWLMFSVLALFTGIDESLLGRQLNGVVVWVFWPLVTLASTVVLGAITVLAGGTIGGLLGFVKRRTQADMSEKPVLNRGLRIAGTVFTIFAVVLLVIGLAPISTAGHESTPNPAADFAGGVQRLEDIREMEMAEPLLPECRTYWKTHERRTEKVVVFYHGLTNCPRQFYELSDVFFDRGYNVIIARHPYHVYEDRDVGHLAGLTPFVYRDMADASLDAAKGLGERVYVVGLSGGGTVAAWVAQYRTDVARSVQLAPFYGSGFIPPAINWFGVNLLSRIPNINLPGSTIITHAYPGNTTRAMGETMRLGEAVRRLAGSVPPASPSVALLVNENDRTVNNGMAESLMNEWAKTGVTPEIYVMPKSLGLPHDLIDMQQEVKDPELVYTAVVDIVEGRAPTFE